MAKDETPQDEDAQDAAGDRKGVSGLFYKLALAGVGGILLAQEEITGLLKRSPSDGEEPEQAEATDGCDSESKKAKADRVDATIDRVLRTLNVPSRTDVDELSERIDHLATRVEQFRAARQD